MWVSKVSERLTLVNPHLEAFDVVGGVIVAEFLNFAFVFLLVRSERGFSDHAAL